MGIKPRYDFDRPLVCPLARFASVTKVSLVWPPEVSGSGWNMRLAILAMLAAVVGFAGPAAALDKVKFGTNWLADPEAGGFYQALVDGTYEKYGLDVTIIPGGPQSNGALMLLFGKFDFFMGGDQIGNFLSADRKSPI